MCKSVTIFIVMHSSPKSPVAMTVSWSNPWPRLIGSIVETLKLGQMVSPGIWRLTGGRDKQNMVGAKFSFGDRGSSVAEDLKAALVPMPPEAWSVSLFLDSSHPISVLKINNWGPIIGAYPFNNLPFWIEYISIACNQKNLSIGHMYFASRRSCFLTLKLNV